MAKPKLNIKKNKVELFGKRAGKYDHESDWIEKYTPHVIYFYYVKPKTGGGYEEAITYMWEEANPITLAQLKAPKGPIAELTENARGRISTVRPIGSGFGQVPWWRRSYLVVALDDKDGFVPGDAVVITRKDGGVNYPNHNFFDGGEEKIHIDANPANPIPVMWTVNYMKNKSGKDIPEGKVHKFGFIFNPINKRRPIVEDNGTNMGPPVPPP